MAETICQHCNRPESEHFVIESPSQTSVGYTKTLFCPTAKFKSMFLGA